MFFTGRMPFLPPNQQHQSTEGTVTITPPGHKFEHVVYDKVSVLLDACENCGNLKSTHFCDTVHF